MPKKMQITDNIFSCTTALVQSADNYKSTIQDLNLSSHSNESLMLLRACKGVFEDLDFELKKVKDALTQTNTTIEPTLLVKLNLMESNLNKIRELLSSTNQ